MTSHPVFHLSLGVRAIEAEIHFFVELLGAKVTHEESDYSNLDVFGTQLTLKEAPGIQTDLREFHFGFNFSLEEFDRISTSIMKFNSTHVAASPTVVDANTVMERKKMYLRTPTGYVVELKGYR